MGGAGSAVACRVAPCRRTLSGARMCSMLQIAVLHCCVVVVVVVVVVALVVVVAFVVVVL